MQGVRKADALGSFTGKVIGAAFNHAAYSTRGSKINSVTQVLGRVLAPKYLLCNNLVKEIATSNIEIDVIYAAESTLLSINGVS
jgi:hypothetical protein